MKRVLFTSVGGLFSYDAVRALRNKNKSGKSLGAGLPSILKDIFVSVCIYFPNWLVRKQRHCHANTPVVGLQIQNDLMNRAPRGPPAIHLQPKINRELVVVTRHLLIDFEVC